MRAVEELRYEFTAELWLYPGEAGWVFATLPVDDAEEIDELVPHKRGFGSVKVTARIGATEWSTSIFPDKASGSYLLPVKRPVRTKEKVDVGDEVVITLSVRFDP